MIVVFKNYLEGVFPNIKNENANLSFALDNFNRLFSSEYPNGTYQFNSESNILLLNSSMEIRGAKGARIGVNFSSGAGIELGRYAFDLAQEVFFIPFNETAPETLFKISNLLVPKPAPIFTDALNSIDLNLDTRNVQDLYLNQPVRLVTTLIFKA